MIIGGKEYQIGDHIRIVSAKSVLHYDYGMKGQEMKESKGQTGVIVAESTYNKDARANLKLDDEYAMHYKNGMTRLFKDDEIELIKE